jgi:hypothetical protein
MPEAEHSYKDMSMGGMSASLDITRPPTLQYEAEQEQAHPEHTATVACQLF